MYKNNTNTHNARNSGRGLTAAARILQFQAQGAGRWEETASATRSFVRFVQQNMSRTRLTSILSAREPRSDSGYPPLECRDTRRGPGSPWITVQKAYVICLGLARFPGEDNYFGCGSSDTSEKCVR